MLYVVLGLLHAHVRPAAESPSLQAIPPLPLPHCPLSRGSSTCFRKAWGPYGRGVAAGGGISSDLPARVLVHSSILWAAPGGGHSLPASPSRQKAVAGVLQEGESVLARKAEANGHGATDCRPKVGDNLSMKWYFP